MRLTALHDVFRPSTAFGVLWRAGLMTTLVVVVSLPMVISAFDLADNWRRDVFVSALICAVSAFPASALVFDQLRRNVVLSGKLIQLLREDRLTGTATRDHFFAEVAKGEVIPGVSLMVDIDHFKQVNDTFGHLAGDRVIQRVAAAIQSSCRPSDIVCRFGGEEFVIYLKDACDVVGEEIAERIRRAVAAERIEVDGQAIGVTVSIGGALRQKSSSINDAIRAADAALYRAKRSGRNRFVPNWGLCAA